VLLSCCKAMNGSIHGCQHRNHMALHIKQGLMLIIKDRSK